ncbi:hypothetical protein [Xanthomonas campestris]|uniref:hypothetical protein n=1 Tax=Xanthomonas campestris TaxID=339 RepID=UPI000E32BE43|nr:hypothetical protein [Xanthomonas campestris]RFF44666.1 hypothetical protein D0A35_21485 [Xanthomonas campestris]
MENSSLLTFKDLVATLGGYTIVVGALAGFLGRVWVLRTVEREKFQLQRQLDQTNKALQSDLDHHLHISKTQFDSEFINYKEIWSLLVELRMKTLRLRPMLDYIEPCETQQERITKRLKEFGPAFTALRDTIEKNKPFYSEQVYKCLSDAVGLCHDEAIDAEYHERPHGEYWKEARANRERISEAIDATCEEIRRRVSSVVVTS